MADISVDLWTWSSTAGNNSPSGSTAIGTGLDDNLRALQAAIKANHESLTSVAGTNTVTATCAGLSAYASGQSFEFIPAATNTGATTINITSLGAKNIFFDGRALVGGELVINIPARIKYDGTQFNLLTPVYISRLTEDTTPDFTADYILTYDVSATSYKKVLLGTTASTLSTEQSASSGTAIDFTGIPSWARKVTLIWFNLSTNGTSQLLVQIGDAGGIETNSYAGGAASFQNSASVATDTNTSGWILTGGSNAAAAIYHGKMEIVCEDPSDNTWVQTFAHARSDSAVHSFGGGQKLTSATMDRVRLTTVNGTDAFDGGIVNISYSA